MILKNRLTHEKLELSLNEFKNRFKKELQTAIECFIKSEKSKPYFMLHEPTEEDFCFDLRWNFNNFGNSVWYIERM